MAICVECEDCFSVFQVKQEKAGSRVRCKNCGAAIDVPDESDELEEDYGRPARSSRASSRRKPARRSQANDNSSFLPIAIFGGIGLAVLVLLGVGAFVAASLFRTDPGQNVAQQENPGMPPNFPQPPNVHPPTFTPPKMSPTPSGSGTTESRPATGSTGSNPSGFRPASGAGGKSVATASEWAMTVDPLPQEEFDSSKKLNLPIPSGGIDDVTYPDASNAFVALGRNNTARDTREFWDLRTAKKIGSLTGVDAFTRNPALSPDGAHFAAELGTRSKGIVVWETKTGKPLGELTVSDAPGFLRLLEFVGPKRLAAMQSGGPLRIWTIPSGDFERDIEVPKTLSPTGIAFSPNGRFVIINSDWSLLEVYNLDTGKLAGKLNLPKPEFGTLTCEFLHFSPDGSEFGGIFTVGVDGRLLMFDTATGRLTVEHLFKEHPRNVPGGGSWYKGRPMEWFPDGSGWLMYGHAIVDRQVGGPIYNAPPQSRTTGPRRIIDAERIAVIAEVGQGAALVALEIPRDEIAKAKDVVKSGGLAVDAGLPPLTAADRGSIKTVSASVSSTWKLSADPAPLPADKLDSNIPIKVTDGVFRGVLLSRADVGQAVVWTDSMPKDARPGRPIRAPRGGTIVRPGSGPSDPKKPLWLDRYDLATGKKTGETTIPVDSELIAFSPDGKAAACVVSALIDENENRIDVWSVEDGEHVAGFRPYGDVKEERNQKITASAFLDQYKLITINPQGLLVMWQLPECKAVYQIEDAKNPQLSPGGRYLSLSNASGVHFFEAATGEPTGELKTGGILAAGAYSSDGKQYAGIVTSTGDDSLCVLWNLENGEMVSEFNLPRGGNSLEFSGPDHLLMSNDTLIDLKQEKIAWRYQPANGQHISYSPDGRHWFVTGGASARDTSIALCAAQLPEQKVIDRLASATLPDESLLKPGAAVSLRVNLTTLPPNKQDLPQEVTARFKQEIERNGFKLTDNAPVTIQVGLTYGGTGKTEEYRFFGAGQQNITVQETKVESSVVAVANGQPVWNRKGSYLNTSYFVSLPKGTDLQTYLAQSQWKNAMNYLLNFTLPSRIFPNNAGQGIGKSTFVAGGVSTGS